MTIASGTIASGTIASGTIASRLAMTVSHRSRRSLSHRALLETELSSTFDPGQSRPAAVCIATAPRRSQSSADSPRSLCNAIAILPEPARARRNRHMGDRAHDGFMMGLGRPADR
jgi:hypothetical protein